MNEIDFQIDSHNIGILTINRPHVHNALNWTAMQAFADAIEQAHEAAETIGRGLRALIITGAGPSFVSGGDINELQAYPTRDDGLRLATIMGNALQRLEALPCITIAAINGPARGGGAEIAVACDLRVMDEVADIGFIQVKMGISTAWGGGQRLLRAIGYSRALELLVTGRVISATDALGFRARRVPRIVGHRVPARSGEAVPESQQVNCLTPPSLATTTSKTPTSPKTLITGSTWPMSTATRSWSWAAAPAASY